MITPPELYYDMYIKGKNEKEILLAISEIKKEINSLKNAIKHPDPNITEFCHPTDSVRLWGNRMYLERAKQELKAIGCVYTLSEEEIKSEIFNARLLEIINLTFIIVSNSEIYQTRTITIDEDYIYLDNGKIIIIKQSKEVQGPYYLNNKDSFINRIQEFHLDEWNTYYNNPNIRDGTQWSLEIEFSNGHEPFRSGGSNSYPFDFEEFLRFLDIDMLIYR